MTQHQCRTRTRRRRRPSPSEQVRGQAPALSPRSWSARRGWRCAGRGRFQGRATRPPSAGCRLGQAPGHASELSNASRVRRARQEAVHQPPLALARVDAPCKPSRHNASPRPGAWRAVLARRRPGPKQRRSKPVERQLRAQQKLPTACCAREDGCAKRPSACAARHGLVPQRTPLQVVNHHTERNVGATSSDRRTSTASSPRLQPSAAKKAL